MSSMFLGGGFLHFLYQQYHTRNKYSTAKLQYLQLYPNCVTTLPDETKTI